MKPNVAWLILAPVLFLNGFLLVAVFDAKRVIHGVEIGVGHEVSGYQLYTEHREVNDYYFPPDGQRPGHPFRGNLVYWFSYGPVLLPWIYISVAASLACSDDLRVPKLLRYVPFGLVTFLLVLIFAHWKTIMKMSSALE